MVSRARAVFGYNCSGPSVPIRDYSYHPDYETNSYSALAMVQLETDFITIDLHPICPPPTYFIEPEFFAMTIMNNCKKPVVKLYEMDFVNPDECKTYYRKSGLDISSMWPTHTTCARAVSGGECVWRSGAVLALRQGGRWRLVGSSIVQVGFGVYGPGCGAPARFLDYSIFQRWVRHTVANIGRPAISRLSPNAMVLRRSLSNLQRYGPCDLDEMKYVIYADHTDIQFRGLNMRTVRYNADNAKKYVKPRLYLRRWCAGAAAMCQDFQNIEIEFYVEIHYKDSVTYDVKAYGHEAKAIDVRRAMKYINENKKRP
ncbi:unnamed protein product [Diatraea saccharalis]|uniref:Peptidase S1 domain-containing protein n=1 Tax=Diatraea saccharalis TaxID=40085 RepID=A0A9N9WI12_9NEOP|nr:unnamed protein product [Diatraea saccharalis]